MRWIVCVMVLAGTAAAETRSPFVLIDQLDGTTRIGADATFLDFRYENMSLRRYGVHGHGVEPRTGLGGYAQLSWFDLDDNNSYVPGSSDTSSSVSGLMNPTFGALWAPSRSERLGFVVHLGFTPASGWDPQKPLGARRAVESTLVRPIDFYAGLLRNSTAHAGGSVVLRDKNRMARVDAGLHIPLGCEEESPGDECNGIGFGFHANAAAGIESRFGLTVSIEASTLWVQARDILSFELMSLQFERTDTDVLATLGLSARYRWRYLQVYALVATGMRKYQNDMVDAGLTLGIEGNL